MDEKEIREGRSLAETPTWTVATVITVMVALGFCLNGSLERLGKWVLRTRRKALLAALEKIKEELMLFGVLSLLMGHWILFVAKICVKSSVFSSSRFYPCAMDGEVRLVGRVTMPRSDQFLNMSVMNKEQVIAVSHGYCPQGHESFASHESLEQLHRLVFVLGVTHVLYSFTTIALAMIKIYSWRAWEDEAKTIALQSLQDAPETEPKSTRFRRLTTFIFHQTSHPWSKHRVLVWLLCFTRQFWSSINRSDYMALRLGFITTHQLPLSYDFHNYMLRSMEDEFRDIVGISIYLWIYTIFCIFLDFHGSHIYFWLSFLPAILILLIGTKLHRVVVKLAVETMDSHSHNENRQFNLRDELFWFGRPRLLLWLIHLISFQNAFEMATFIWSLWEIREPSCFMENRTFLVIRIVFGVSSQFWCSFITFPLYVIVTQMGSSFKKSLMSENIRGSLLGWRRRVQAKKGNSTTTALLTGVSTRSSDFDHDHVVKDTTHKNVDDDSVSITNRGSSVGFKTNTSCEHEQEDVEDPFELHDQTTEIYSQSSQSDDERLQFSHFDDDAAHYDSYRDDERLQFSHFDDDDAHYDSYRDDERLQFSHFDDDAAHYDSYREDVYHDDER